MIYLRIHDIAHVSQDGSVHADPSCTQPVMTTVLEVSTTTARQYRPRSYPRDAVLSTSSPSFNRILNILCTWYKAHDADIPSCSSSYSCGGSTLSTLCTYKQQAVPYVAMSKSRCTKSCIIRMRIWCMPLPCLSLRLPCLLPSSPAFSSCLCCTL